MISKFNNFHTIYFLKKDLYLELAQKYLLMVKFSSKNTACHITEKIHPSYKFNATLERNQKK